MLHAINPNVDLLVVESDESFDRYALREGRQVPPNDILDDFAVRKLDVIIVRFALSSRSEHELADRNKEDGTLYGHAVVSLEG